MRLIETGRWLGLVPGSALRFGGKAMHFKALPLQTPMPPAPVGVIMVNNRTLTPLAERFIQCTRRAAGLDLGPEAPKPSRCPLLAPDGRPGEPG